MEPPEGLGPDPMQPQGSHSLGKEHLRERGRRLTKKWNKRWGVGLTKSLKVAFLVPKSTATGAKGGGGQVSKKGAQKKTARQTEKNGEGGKKRSRKKQREKLEKTITRTNNRMT